MQACTNSLCGSSTCFCSDYNMLSACTGSCKNFTAGLTVACAACVGSLFGASMCPDFTMTSDGGAASVLAGCASVCAHTDGGAGKG